MLTKNDILFCDYDTSVALQKLGFKEKCPTYYDSEDNVGLLYNTQWTFENMPCQFVDCLESHNTCTYDDCSYVDAPTIYQAQRWLIENRNLHVSTRPYVCEDGIRWMYEIRQFSNVLVKLVRAKTGFCSPDESLSEGIKMAIEYIYMM